MTPEQQRIAIAEWMGAKTYPAHNMQDMDERRYFECSRCGLYQCWTDYSKNGHPKGLCLDSKIEYENDLNAMHGAEKKLSAVERIDYISILWKKSPLFTDNAWNLNQAHYSQTIWWALTTATSAQRSEALCRTLWPNKFA